MPLFLPSHLSSVSGRMPGIVDFDGTLGHKVSRMDNRIRPGELIRKEGVGNLLAAADRPFAETPDPVPLMAKPFGNPGESPDLLYNLSILLASMKLGRTMTVVDFGAGSCWLSRCLNQMGCITIAVDPSESALEMGRKMFALYPVMGGSIKEPSFLKFDGHRIPLSDGSVDRIMCFDSFHHVPNPGEVLKEFGRILKPGGLAGFSEPGRFHSRTAQSQHEMRTWGVLENDVIIENIMEQAKQGGFTDISIKMAANPRLEMPLSPYLALAGRRVWQCLFKPMSVAALLGIQFGLLKSVLQRSIFVLQKGAFVPDCRLSCSATGKFPDPGEARDLACAIYCDKTEIRVKPLEQAVLRVKVVNTGTVKWLRSNIADYAAIKLGIHLCDGNMRMLDCDYHRHELPRDVMPGEGIECDVCLPAFAQGNYNAVLDMVSEQVCWFEACGNKPVAVNITCIPG